METCFHPVLLSVMEEKKGIMSVSSLNLFPFIGYTVHFSPIIIPTIIRNYAIIPPNEKKHLVDTICTYIW